MCKITASQPFARLKSWVISHIFCRWDRIEKTSEINPNWHEGGYFYLLVLFWIRACQLNFYQKFPNFFCGENWHLWQPVKLIEYDEKMPIGVAKEEYFSCFHSSCLWGLSHHLYNTCGINWDIFLTKLPLPHAN